VEEVVHAAEGARDHRRILPRRYPAANASPTKRARRKKAKTKTLMRSPGRVIVSISVAR
jgi:hypothetical protein